VDGEEDDCWCDCVSFWEDEDEEHLDAGADEKAGAEF
jgi:hypothetical protein